ncbi:melatonin receptor type 1A-like [Amphiura filiformis]|uniref:melatonin receptor type 1A-like n=1 Tax=Amphiura filiformis TaxID=82378 RepID=UPI003B212510
MDITIAPSVVSATTDGNYSDAPASLGQLFLPIRFIPYFIFLVLMTLMGTSGNILIMVSVALNKKLQVISNVFVVNLALADISISAVIIPITAIGLFNDAEFNYNFPIVCTVLGPLVVVSCACSIWSIVSISLERYLHICHPASYRKFYNRQSVPFIVLCVWFIAAAIALPYFDFFGWGSYVYLYRGRVCTWTYTGSYFYSYYLIGLGLIVPMIIIPYCYIRIYMFVKKSKQRMLKHRSEVNGNLKDSQKWKSPDIKILKTVATIWAAFMIMWAPYTANVVFNIHDTWPDSYMQTGVALCLSNSSINFIIYGIMNQNFRRSYSMIYHKIICGKWGRELSETDTEGSSKGNSTLKHGSSVATLTIASTHANI